MPKTETDYSKIVIYIIKHESIENLIYVGSTTNFIKRRARHKCNALRETKDSGARLYQTINQNGGWDCFVMLQLKEFPCDNKRQAEMEEENCRISLKATLNVNKCFSSNPKKEWLDRNHEAIKEYYHENKIQINALRRQKYKLKKELSLEFPKN